jgi:hypothetical protein
MKLREMTSHASVTGPPVGDGEGATIVTTVWFFGLGFAIVTIAVLIFGVAVGAA